MKTQRQRKRKPIPFTFGYVPRAVDAAAFQKRTRRRAGLVQSLRAIREVAQELGFDWETLVKDV